MITSTMNTGDKGQLRVDDHTDGSNKIVEMWIRSLSPVSIPQVPWRYSVDGSSVGWSSFNFQSTTLWQKLGMVHVGNAQNFILHLGNTGTSHLAGPTDLSVNLYGHVPPGPAPPTPRLASVRVGGSYKKAQAYVRVGGVWKLAEPFVRSVGGWKKIT